jgi:hypothetical protein
LEELYLLGEKFSRYSVYSESNLYQLKIGKLEQILDRLCSIIVIARDRKCITCGTRVRLSNSHYQPRRHRAFRWDLRNCNCQCFTCNENHNHNKEDYADYILSFYGEEVYDLLNSPARAAHVTREDRIRIFFELLEEGGKYFEPF